MDSSYNIAIIGAHGVGKSAFIQHALDLAQTPATKSSSVRMAVDNVTHTVTLLELGLEHFELNQSQPIQWPKEIDGHVIPRVDAALILYDVVSQDSIRGLPQMVASLNNSGLPAALGACKCDHPEDDWDVNVNELAQLLPFKLCLDEIGGEAVSRRRTHSAINLEAPEPSGGRPLSVHSGHSGQSWASSDISVYRAFPNQQQGDAYRRQFSRSPRPGFRNDGPSGNSFLDIDESGSGSRRSSNDISSVNARRGDDAVAEKPNMAGVAFEELVDRLLAPRLSRVDNNFSDIFLCLYRKFAAPGQLLSAILVRLEKVRNDELAPYLIKMATQLRIVEVIAKWVSLYPGDFARPATRRNLEDLIKHLSTEPIFTIAAQQMRHNLHSNVIEDDDTGWANSDTFLEGTSSNVFSKEMEELSTDVSSLQFDAQSDVLLGGSDRSSMDRGSRAGSQFPFSSSEEYEREAMLLEPSDHLPMDKARYHTFMDISDNEIAEELTRIDWIMFSSIRVRDFVRHVSLSTAQRDKCKGLQNVNRMINHFNHVAKWVVNMIILRDKAKHRAQMLEKFMSIALKLRQLNNYNGLAAVLAGINETAIHRLAQTRALVSAEVQKRFARLVILMGTQKSHFAYRLAWENSPLPRIPFLPLHRRDLVSAEEGSKTFVGPNEDRINWKKFEVLGEILLPIMKSQGAAYPKLTKHDTARDLILGCRMPMDDEVWERLELGLVPVSELREGRANRVTYSLQHPDLSSAWAPPDAAAVAVLRSALYSIDLLTSQTSKDEKGDGGQRSGKKIKLCSQGTSAPIACANDENAEYNKLGSADRHAVDDFLENFKTNFEVYLPYKVPKKRGALEEATDALTSPHTNILLSAWLESAFSGRGRTSKTEMLTQKLPAAPLSRLAPGVFDVPYLKVLTLVPERICEARIHLHNLSIPGPYEQRRVSQSAQEGGKSRYGHQRPR
ncbi:hypothetical protein E4U41_002585 [Claviceps citrina]|nr:hypothetical protein E4U41_002585 [Claviceps citrina]